MAAPTASSELSIQDRLESLLADAPPPTAEVKDTQDTNEEEPPKIEDPSGDPEPLAADSSEEDPPVVEDPEASEEAANAEASEEEISTMSDLAKMFEVEESELLNQLHIDTGDGKTVKLGEVIKTYQNAPEAVRRYEEFQGQQSAFVTETAQMRERTDIEVRNLAATAQALLDITNEDFKDVNWKELETEDPQSYLILKNKQAERGAAISGAIEKLRAVEHQRVADLSADGAKTRQSEMAELARKMPEWADQEVAKSAMQETQQLLLDVGYSAEQINAIDDHKHLIVAWKAAQWDKLNKKAPKKIAKLRGLPKPKNVLQAGARRESSGDAKKQSQQNFDRLRQTGDEKDAARLMEELL